MKPHSAGQGREIGVNIGGGVYEVYLPPERANNLRDSGRRSSFAVHWLGQYFRSLDETNAGGLATLQDALKRVEAELATAKESMPGLGDYMTMIQLHVGKTLVCCESVKLAAGAL
jgi:hypothetical protein